MKFEFVNLYNNVVNNPESMQAGEDMHVEETSDV